MRAPRRTSACRQKVPRPELVPPRPCPTIEISIRWTFACRVDSVAGPSPDACAKQRQEGNRLMSETPTFGRYAEIPYDKMTPEQQEGYKAMIEARGRLPGPTKIWVHNPKLAKVVGPFGAHFQPGQYSLSEREREIAVCVITSHWHSAYPTSRARTAGQGGRAAGRQGRGDRRRPADRVRRQTRAGRLRDGDRALQRRAGCRGGSTTARSRRSATSASPTSSP